MWIRQKTLLPLTKTHFIAIELTLTFPHNFGLFSISYCTTILVLSAVCANQMTKDRPLASVLGNPHQEIIFRQPLMNQILGHVLY